MRGNGIAHHPGMATLMRCTNVQIAVFGMRVALQILGGRALFGTAPVDQDIKLGVGQRGALGLGFRERHVGPGTELL